MELSKLQEKIDNQRAQMKVEDMKEEMSVLQHLMESDMKAIQGMTEIWKALCDIQLKLNQLYWDIHQDERSGSGSGSGQLTPKSEPAPLVNPVAQEQQANYQPLTKEQVADRVAAFRNQVNAPTNQPPSRPSY